MSDAACNLPQAFTKSADAPQAFSGVAAAELARLVHKRTPKVLLILLLASGLSYFSFVFASSQLPESAPSQVAAANGFLSMSYFLLGVYTVCSVAREHEDGCVLATLSVVPNRLRLYAARLAAWSLLTICAGAIGYIAFFLAAAPFQENPFGGVDAAELASGFALSMVKCAFTAVLCFSIGTMLRRVGLGLVVYFALDAIGAMLLSLACISLPDATAGVVSKISDALPGSLVHALTDAGSGELATTLLALLAWAVAAALCSIAVFRRVKK